MGFHHADAAAEVPESHQLFAKDLESNRQVLEIVREAHRLPEAAQVLPARSPRAYAGQFGVFFRYVSVVVTAVSGR
jgi:hypothetical protein